MPASIVYVITGGTDYSPTDVLAVIVDGAAFKKQCEEYDATEPPREIFNKAAYEKWRKWGESHPAAKFSKGTGYDYYEVLEVELLP
jgi:hypothetical protein